MNYYYYYFERCVFGKTYLIQFSYFFAQVAILSRLINAIDVNKTREGDADLENHNITYFRKAHIIEKIYYICVADEDSVKDTDDL